MTDTLDAPVKPSYAELEKRVAELERKMTDWDTRLIRKLREHEQRTVQEVARMTRLGGSYSRAIRG